MDVWLICGKCRHRIKQLSNNWTNVEISLEGLRCNCPKCGESHCLIINARIREKQPQVVEATYEKVEV